MKRLLALSCGAVPAGDLPIGIQQPSILVVPATQGSRRTRA